MNRNSLVLACALGVVLSRPGASLADSPTTGARDLASEVLAVFSVKCAGCHGANLAKPKGKFGYVLDLKRLAGNPDMVVSGKPDESELLTLIRNGDMPPPDAKTGLLSDEQKEVVAAWITAGAPADSPTPPSPSTEAVFRPTPPLDPANEVVPVAGSLVSRLLRQAGKLHLMLLHFPIALLIAAAFGELWTVWKRPAAPSQAVRFCLCLGAAAAVPTVVCGWLFALGGNGVGQPDLLALHRWIGTAAGATAVAAAVFSEWDARRGTGRLGVRLTLFVAVVLVVLTAHFGGLLVHGKDFFDS